MAKIDVCDGCGEQSPDAKGLFIANHWYRVTTRMLTRVGDDVNKYKYCRQCWEGRMMGHSKEATDGER